jgi:DNA polymerase
MQIPVQQAKGPTGKTREGVWESDEISFYGPIAGKANWGMVSTHGAKLIENICQAIGGDFMCNGAVRAEQAGYEIFMVVHDQALATYHPEKGNTAEGFKEALCNLPAWAKGFPLDAVSSVVPFYTKD